VQFQQPHGRQHIVDRNRRRDAIFKAEPLEAGHGKECGVSDALAKLAQPALNVAAEVDDTQIGPDVERLGQGAAGGPLCDIHRLGDDGAGVRKALARLSARALAQNLDDRRGDGVRFGLYAVAARDFLRQVCTCMFLALALTTGVAIWFHQSNTALNFFATHHTWFYVALFGQLAMVLALRGLIASAHVSVGVAATEEPSPFTSPTVKAAEALHAVKQGGRIQVRVADMKAAAAKHA